MLFDLFCENHLKLLLYNYKNQAISTVNMAGTGAYTVLI